MTIVPSVLKDDALLKAHLEKLMEVYGSDVASLDTKLQLWKCKWASSMDHMPSSPAEALPYANEPMYSLSFVYNLYTPSNQLRVCEKCECS